MKITLISHDDWGFNRQIADELERKGHVVTNINFSTLKYKYPNFFYRIYNFFLKAFLKKNLKNIHFGKQIIQILEKNKENPKITELESGLQYEILVEGNGEIPKITDEVEVEYEGYLLDSQVFDSTKDVGAQLFRISEMIEGWKEVLTKMQEGSRWKVYIPSHLAYGENGAPPMIQPNATLVFIIELNKIVR